MPDIKIEIDGKEITTQPGKMLIQVADENDIYIPRFCYHKKLTVAANCRMCLVEVEKAPKTLPACATPINDGMKVFTQSAKTLESQRAVMEFLLINHPLDCPICDQGGQCELQDYSMGYGKDNSSYNEEKRAVANDDFGPLIATEMTRCIQCTRCVRFGKEIAGVREIGMVGRGEHSQISTYVKHTVDHELSGNIIDLCPVGALLSKPFLYKARAWELKAHDGISPHDGVGSHLSIHTRRNEVMRVVSRENNEINETWISDRDRFSYQGLNVNRLEKPMIKDDKTGEWREVTWPVALNFASNALEKIKAAHGANQIGALVSPNSTLEEAHLIKKLWDHLGSEQIEYRLRKEGDQPVAPTPSLNIAIADIENQKTIILIGSHLRNDQPILAHLVRKAALKGAKIHVIDSVRHPYQFDLASETIVKPSMMVAAVSNYVSADVGSPSLIIMGENALNHPDAAKIQSLLDKFATDTQSVFAQLPEGANAMGCAKLFSQTNINASLKAYLLHNIEPEFDVANPQKLQRDLLSADMVVAVTPFISEHLKQVAKVLLPCAAFTETSGTFMNLAGEQHSFTGCVTPKGEARPAWKIYRVLNNLLSVPECEFESSEDVLKAWVHAKPTENRLAGVGATGWSPSQTLQDNQLERITTWPDCRSDNLVRRARALNERAIEKHFEAVHIHEKTAKQLQLSNEQQVQVKQNDLQVVCKLVIDNQIVPGAVFIAGGTLIAAQLGSSFGVITVEAKNS
ncbi:MAG: NADH-quinone oxidoreductase subunit NuoG [Pseudomonadota bacterium]